MQDIYTRIGLDPPYLCNRQQPGSTNSMRSIASTILPPLIDASRFIHCIRFIPASASSPTGRTSMLYYSLNDPSTAVTFKEATIRGEEPPTKASTSPNAFPIFPADFLEQHRPPCSRADIAFWRVIRPYTSATPSPNPNSAASSPKRSISISLSSPSPPPSSIPRTLSRPPPSRLQKDVGARFMRPLSGLFRPRQSISLSQYS